LASIIDTYARTFLAYIERRRKELQHEHDATMKAAAVGFPLLLRKHIAKRLGVEPDRVSVKLRGYNPDDDDRSLPSNYDATVGGLDVEGFGDDLADISPEVLKMRQAAEAAGKSRALHCRHDGLKEARTFAGRMRMMHGEKLGPQRLEALASDWIAGKGCGC
jgi:hypothetical protein